MPDDAQFGRRQKTEVALLGIVAAFLVGWLLRETYLLTMPLTVAFFVAVLVRPLQKLLGRHLPPRLVWLSLVPTVLAILAAIGGVMVLMWLALYLVPPEAAEHLAQLGQRWDRLLERIAERGLPIPAWLDGTHTAGQRVLELGAILVAHAGQILMILTLIFFFTLLMLVEADEWKSKLCRLNGHDSGQTAMSALEDLSTKIRRYMIYRTLISTITGVLTFLWLWVMGVEMALLWGVTAFLLNYIPNIGSIIAVIPPTLMALVQMGFAPAAGVIVGLAIIQNTLGNYIEPRLQGRALSVSPTVLLGSLIFWSWVWGVGGALLAIPLTVTIATVCGRIEPLKPIGLFLSRSVNEPLFPTVAPAPKAAPASDEG